jgi:hypothetical protein
MHRDDQVEEGAERDQQKPQREDVLPAIRHAIGADQRVLHHAERSGYRHLINSVRVTGPMRDLCTAHGRNAYQPNH